MSESETAATGRRDFLQTVVAAPVLAAALVDTAQAAARAARRVREARPPGTHGQSRRSRDELRGLGPGDESGPAAHPRPDGVVVGVREGHRASRQGVPGLRRGSPRPGTQHLDAAPLHAGQHGQRPRALHRPGDQAAGDHQWMFVGRRAVGVVVGLCHARTGAWLPLRRSTALFLGIPTRSTGSPFARPP